MCDSEIHLKRLDHSSSSAFALSTGTVVVGRAPTCDIVLPDIDVSRLHAELSVTELGVTVRDLGSRNGTYVDEERIQSRFVGLGQRLRFGGADFVVTGSGQQGQTANGDLETKSVNRSGSLAVSDFSGLPLSAAERRVFDLLLEGLAEKQVARRLGISRHTVHNHLREIYRALRVHSRSELLARFLPRRDGETFVA